MRGLTGRNTRVYRWVWSLDLKADMEGGGLPCVGGSWSPEISLYLELHDHVVEPIIPATAHKTAHVVFT